MFLIKVSQTLCKTIKNFRYVHIILADELIPYHWDELKGLDWHLPGVLT